MKTKRSVEKLALNKRTVANLEINAMKLVMGGWKESAYPCPFPIPSVNYPCASGGETCDETCAATCANTCDDYSCALILCPAETNPGPADPPA